MKRVRQITSPRFDLDLKNRNIELVLTNGDKYYVEADGYYIDRLCTCMAGYTGVSVSNFKKQWMLSLPANSIKEIWELDQDLKIEDHVFVRNYYDTETNDSKEIVFKYYETNLRGMLYGK